MKSDRYRKGVPPVFAESQPKYLQDELTKIERVLDLGYDDLTQVNADGTVLRASINTERTLRVTADEALASQITTLTATVTSDRANASASLTSEQTARATADTAIAQSITTLTAAVDTNKTNANASLIAEQTARATADTAIASSVTTLAATVTGNDTAINARVATEETARATKDTALATLITNLTATVTGNNTAVNARVDTEASARATADTATATSITNLTATVTGNKTNGDAATTAVNARVDTEASARATADAANATLITNLTAMVTGNKTNGDAATAAVSADLQSEKTVRATADTANATAITNLTATVTGNNTAVNARVDSEVSARATADSANATAITNLSTTVGGHTTSISQTLSSINGLSAMWGVKIKSGNRVAGVVLNSGASGTSSFDIEADGFNVYVPGTNTRSLYWDGTQLVVRGDILANSITVGAVNNLGNNSVNRPVIGAPNVVASGTFACNSTAGYTSGDGICKGFTELIDTGLNVTSAWSVASTDQYLATATVASGTSVNGGHVGVSKAEVVVGDALISVAPYQNDYVDNRIYILFTFLPSGAMPGAFTAKSISWKLARI